MTIPRSQQIDLSSTPYYHVMTRCVRRSYLCGTDSVTGRNFSHRKAWLAERIKDLTDIFSIKIQSYSIMSNHYHIVLGVESEIAKVWSDDEILNRWHLLFPNDAAKFKALVQRGMPEALIKKKYELWRERLMSISWFMRAINEPLARISNIEDKCSGHFWEGRFKSQALLDEAAILSAMAYVDLNPIRAKVALTPETSEYTSIHERIKYASKQLKRKSSKRINISEITQVCDTLEQPPKLSEFASKVSENLKTGLSSVLSFTLAEYLQLVDETGRVIREDKRGAIPESLPPILERLNLSSEGWYMLVNKLESAFSYWVGQEQLQAVLDRDNRGLSLKLGPQRYPSIHLKAA